MRIAIMQPTYLPWTGYFDLMDQVDTFVFLDDVEFSRQSWQQRNRVKGPQGLQWLTVPVRVKSRSRQLICDTEIADSAFGKKHLRTLKVHYGRAPFSRAYLPALGERLTRPAGWRSLAELNRVLITWIAGQLGIETRLVSASELHVEGVRGQRIARICQALGADEYVSPAGATTYLIQDLPHFDAARTRVVIQGFEHPVYPQLYPPFAAHACACDLLLNVGAAAGSLMRSGRRPAMPLVPVAALASPA